jgi:TonB family protein
MNKYFLPIVFIPFLLACSSSRMGGNQGNQNVIIDLESLQINSVVQDVELIQNNIEQFNNSEGMLVSLVSIKPTFNGDTTRAEFNNYINHNVRYPLEAMVQGIAGRVVVGFIIDEEGTVSDAWVIRSAHPLLDNEVLRVIKASPEWTPGIYEGEPVKTKMIIPFTFNHSGVIYEDVRPSYLRRNRQIMHQRAHPYPRSPRYPSSARMF